jgi:hypothetical protein
MTSDQSWNRIKQLFQEVVDREPEERFFDKHVVTIERSSTKSSRCSPRTERRAASRNAPPSSRSPNRSKATAHTVFRH